jgi:hypothetical protein
MVDGIAWSIMIPVWLSQGYWGAEAVFAMIWVQIALLLTSIIYLPVRMVKSFISPKEYRQA